jgi:hypothetical protein
MSEEELMEACGYKYRCISYAYTCETSPRYQKTFAVALQSLLKMKARIFLDSGAHTFQEMIAAKVQRRGIKKTSTDYVKQKVSVQGQVEEYVTGYIEYVREHGHEFDFFVNFDYVQEVATVYDVYQRMAKAGVPSVPVYHGDGSLEWLRRYVDQGNQLIGIGWSPLVDARRNRRKYYEQVFNYIARLKTKVYLHGFACTGTDLLAYPWFSVDSTTWLKAAVYGLILTMKTTGNFQSKVIKPLPVSHRKSGETSMDWQALRTQVEALGFDLDELRSSTRTRALYNIRFFQELSKNHTSQGARRIPWKSSLF